MSKLLPLLAFSISAGHLAKQFLWFGIGLLIAIVLSLIIFQILWKALHLEAIKASKLAIVTGLLLTFIWFTILFNTFVSFYLIIIIGIIVIGILFLVVSNFEEN